eukprot:TRINITY_DN23065_c0_g1_i1.p1 TRINITY_DN23065_c0_g1~~TRINITY_DN23065_c0_g1_i1.p1  ORF type:complete len:690 (-),score=147.04 TRINITY_DN23065_c0_g1_i1:199-2268(-)
MAALKSERQASFAELQIPEDLGGASAEEEGSEAQAAEHADAPLSSRRTQGKDDGIQALLDHCDRVQSGWQQPYAQPGRKEKPRAASKPPAAQQVKVEDKEEVVGSPLPDNTKALLEHIKKVQADWDETLGSLGDGGDAVDSPNRAAAAPRPDRRRRSRETTSSHKRSDASSAAATPSRASSRHIETPKQSPARGSSLDAASPMRVGPPKRRTANSTPPGDLLPEEGLELAQALLACRAALQEAKAAFASPSPSPQKETLQLPPADADAAAGPTNQASAPPSQRAVHEKMPGRLDGLETASPGSPEKPAATSTVVLEDLRREQAQASLEDEGQTPSSSAAEDWQGAPALRKPPPLRALSREAASVSEQAPSQIRSLQALRARIVQEDTPINSARSGASAEEGRARLNSIAGRLLQDMDNPAPSRALRPPLMRPRGGLSAVPPRLDSLAGRRWRVIGGSSAGGIIVREGRELSSRQLAERLATGALLEEEELVGERLRFSKVEGDGPDSGWVSLSLKGKKLVQLLSDSEGTTFLESLPKSASGSAAATPLSQGSSAASRVPSSAAVQANPGYPGRGRSHSAQPPRMPAARGNAAVEEQSAPAAARNGRRQSAPKSSASKPGYKVAELPAHMRVRLEECGLDGDDSEEKRRRQEEGRHRLPRLQSSYSAPPAMRKKAHSKEPVHLPSIHSTR